MEMLNSNFSNFLMNGVGNFFTKVKLFYSASASKHSSSASSYVTTLGVVVLLPLTCWLAGPSLIVFHLYVSDRHRCCLLCLYLLVAKFFLAEDDTWLCQPWFPARGGSITPDVFSNVIDLYWYCYFFGMLPDFCPWQNAALIPWDGYVGSSFLVGYMLCCESVLSIPPQHQLTS